MLPSTPFQRPHKPSQRPPSQVALCHLDDFDARGHDDGHQVPGTGTETDQVSRGSEQSAPPFDLLHRVVFSCQLGLCGEGEKIRIGRRHIGV